MQNKQTLSKPLVVMLLAGLCCLLWGSAIPFINLGYRYFGVSAGDTATQILFGGCRFFLAGFLTILFESVARKSPAFPKRTSWGNVVKLSLAQTIIQYVFFYIGVAHTASAKGAIIQGLQAFTSILIACFIFRTERMNALKWIGGLIGVAGGRLVSDNPMAYVVLLYLALLSAVAYSLWAVLLRVNPVSRVAVYTFLQPIFGVILSLLLVDRNSDAPLLRYAAALVSLKLETPGPFTGTADDVYAYMKAYYDA